MLIASWARILVAATLVSAAPPSSPLSVPMRARPSGASGASTFPSTFRVTEWFKCTGYYNSFSCANTLSVNNCKNTIKLEWHPLKIPGSKEWALTHRNFCTVTWRGEEAIEEKMYKPEKCEELVKIMAAGLQGFPEVKWQDANCNLIGTTDGIFYSTQHWERPKPQPHFTEPTKDPDPEPRAIRLEDVRGCVLHNKKERVMHCPVLPQIVQSWLRKLLAALDVSLVVQNDVR